MNKDTFSFPVQIPEIFIPPTYNKVLKDKDNEYVNSLVKQYISPHSKSRFLFEKHVKKEELVESLSKFFLSAVNIKNIFNRMERGKFYFIKRIIHNNGILFYNEVKDKNMIHMRSLINEGLLFTTKNEGRNFLTVPLEICHAFPLERNEQINSLLLALNNYPFPFTKIMASNWSIPIKTAKLLHTIPLYTSIVQNYEKTFAHMTHDQYVVLKEIFSRGGKVSSSSLQSWVQETDHSYKPQRGYYYGSLRDPIQSFLYYPQKENLQVESKMYQALIMLIIKGVISFQLNDTYSYSIDYFISSEISPSVSDVFFKEMDMEFTQITEKLYTSAPETSVSYASRICDDLIKVQVAVVCNLLGRTHQGEFKKRSLTLLTKLLDAEESYIYILLGFFHYTRKGSDFYTLKKIEYNTFEFLKKTLLDKTSTRELLSVINTYKSEWMKRELFISSLLIHKKLYHLKSVMTRNSLDRFLRETALLGLLEVSQAGDKVRITPLLHEIFEKKSLLSVPVIKAKEKPLLIQANLELLMPFNVEMKIITDIALFADLKVVDKMLHFILTRNSLMRAFDNGWDSEKVKNKLSSLSTVTIPQSVETFIDTIGAKKGEAEITWCNAVIRCTGLGIKEKILSMKGLKGLELLSLVGMDDFIIVRGRNAEDIVKMLKNKGIFAEIGEI